MRSTSSSSMPSPDLRRVSRKRESSLAEIRFGSEAKVISEHVLTNVRQIQRRDAICNEVKIYF
jgi:hypothetical protein